MVDVRLCSMTSDEFGSYKDEAVLLYAEANVMARNWPAVRAEQRARQEYEDLLPEGLSTPGHHLYTARCGRQRVGVVWFGEQPSDIGRVAYLYDVKIDAGLRGGGYGDALMRAFESKARAFGMDFVRLQVFGSNSSARSLYRKLGYSEANVFMLKRLEE